MNCFLLSDSKKVAIFIITSNLNRKTKLRHSLSKYIRELYRTKIRTFINNFCPYITRATKEHNDDDRQNQHTILTKINRSDRMMFIHWIKRS